MTKSAEAYDNETDQKVQPDIDSKYRLIIVAAKRSKQIQRGANPRVEMDLQKHKPTRVALEELNQKRVPFRIIKEE